MFLKAVPIFNQEKTMNMDDEHIMILTTIALAISVIGLIIWGVNNYA